MGTFYGPNGPQSNDKPYDVVKVVPEGYVLYHKDDPFFVYFSGQNVPLKNGVIVNYQDSNWILESEDVYKGKFLNREVEELFSPKKETVYFDITPPNESVRVFLEKINQKKNDKENNEEKQKVDANKIFSPESISLGYVQSLIYFLTKAKNSLFSKAESDAVIDLATNLFFNSGEYDEKYKELIKIHMKAVNAFLINDVNPTNIYHVYSNLYKNYKIVFPLEKLGNLSLGDLVSGKRLTKEISHLLVGSHFPEKIDPFYKVAILNALNEKFSFFEDPEEQEFLLSFYADWLFSGFDLFHIPKDLDWTNERAGEIIAEKINGFMRFFQNSSLYDYRDYEENKLMKFLILQEMLEIYQDEIKDGIKRTILDIYWRTDDKDEILKAKRRIVLTRFLGLDKEKVKHLFKQAIKNLFDIFKENRLSNIKFPDVMFSENKESLSLLPELNEEFSPPRDVRFADEYVEEKEYYRELYRFWEEHESIHELERVIWFMSSPYLFGLLEKDIKEKLKNFEIFPKMQRLLLLAGKYKRSTDKSLYGLVKTIFDDYDLEKLFLDEYIERLFYRLSQTEPHKAFAVLVDLYNLGSQTNFHSELRDFGYHLFHKYAKEYDKNFAELAPFVYSSQENIAETFSLWVMVLEEYFKNDKSKSSINVLSDRIPSLIKSLQDIIKTFNVTEKTEIPELKNIFNAHKFFEKVGKEGLADTYQVAYYVSSLYKSLKTLNKLTPNNEIVRNSLRQAFLSYYFSVFRSLGKASSFNPLTKQQFANVFYKMIKDIEEFELDKDFLEILSQGGNFSFFGFDLEKRGDELVFVSPHHVIQVSLTLDEAKQAFKSDSLPFLDKSLYLFDDFINSLAKYLGLNYSILREIRKGYFGENIEKGVPEIRLEEDIFDKNYLIKDFDKVENVTYSEEENSFEFEFDGQKYKIVIPERVERSVFASYGIRQEKITAKEALKKFLTKYPLFNKETFAIFKEGNIPIHGGSIPLPGTNALLSPYHAYHVSEYISNYLRNQNPNIYNALQNILKHFPVYIDFYNESSFYDDQKIVIYPYYFKDVKDFDALKNLNGRKVKEILSVSKKGLDLVFPVTSASPAEDKSAKFIETFMHEVGHLLHGIAKGEALLRKETYEKLVKKPFNETRLKENYHQELKLIGEKAKELAKLELSDAPSNSKQKRLGELLNLIGDLLLESDKRIGLSEGYAKYTDLTMKVYDLNKDEAKEFIMTLEYLLRDYGYEGLYSLANYSEIMSSFFENLAAKDSPTLGKARRIYNIYMKPIFESLGIPDPYTDYVEDTSINADELLNKVLEEIEEEKNEKKKKN